MGRFLAGVASALLLVVAGLFFWQGADSGTAAVPLTLSDEAEPQGAQDALFASARMPSAPSAPAKSKEEKRFNRYDKDRNGAVSGGEYLFSRRKAYDRIDANHDGVLSFSEYATKASLKFAKADRDRSGSLTRTEFETTKVVRKFKARPDCVRAPMIQPKAAPSAGSEDEES